MANKNLFRSSIGELSPKTDAVNEESAPAYRFSDKHALAQFAATGCMNSTFYATDAEQLGKVVVDLSDTLSHRPLGIRDYRAGLDNPRVRPAQVHHPIFHPESGEVVRTRVADLCEESLGVDVLLLEEVAWHQMARSG